MKPSHISTPRTLSACTFETGYQCVPFKGGNGPAWRLVKAAIVWGFFAAVGVALAVVLSR